MNKFNFPILHEILYSSSGIENIDIQIRDKTEKEV